MTLTPFHIEYLADHPQHAPTLARWHHAAWSPILPDWSLAEAVAELATHRARRAIPTTLVAFAAGEPVGSVSLLANDHERIRKYSPWLASLYVREDRRGDGVGTALVARLIDEAAALGVARLYLYTHDAQDYYLRLGWREVDRVDLGTVLASVMAMEMGSETFFGGASQRDPGRQEKCL